MKKLLILIGLVCSIVTIHAQSRSNVLSKGAYECIYEYKVKADNGNIDNYTTILQLGNTCAKFMDYAAYRYDSIRVEPNADAMAVNRTKEQMMKANAFFDQTVYQNSPKTALTVYCPITPDYYTYQEKAFGIQWTLSEETKAVCGYECKKAQGNYGGKTWTVWYAPEISSSYGPWKLCGLPGLVLAASESEGVHSFEAITFRQGVVDITDEGSIKPISTNREKFVKAKNNFEKDPLNNIPPEAISNMTVIKGEDGKNAILINGAQLRIHVNGYVPLEVE